MSARFPWPPYTGDRLRVVRWLQALRHHAEVTLITPHGQIPDEFQYVTHVQANKSLFSLVAAAYRALGSRIPLHALITAGYNWKSVLRQASNREFDVAIVMLSRLDPWIDSHIHAPRRILDAIDSLALSVTRRAQAARGLSRIFWLAEARKMRAFESEIAPRYERILVVNADELSLFGGRAAVIPIGISGSDERDEARPESPLPYDFGFWGRLGFFANHDAAIFLLDEIWPRIRERFPGATLLIAGAQARRSVRRHHGANGVTVISPVDDLRSLIRKVRIAIFPIRFGTGQSIKALEAAEAGCAILTTPQGLRGVEPLAAGAIVEPAPARLADHAISLLERPEEIRDMGRRSKEALEQHFSAATMEARMRDIVIGPAERRV